MRRNVTTTALFICLVIAVFSLEAKGDTAGKSAVPAAMNIWEGTDCDKKVELTPYLLEGENNPVVVVCPGGSYFWHDIDTEGHEVARWLNSNGISAFVLKYRAGGINGFIWHYRYCSRGNRYPDPQDDLRQALRLVRANAGQFGIDPRKVGAMGFSAGGHLVMSAGELFEPDDRPDFIVPVYPVVTFVDPCMHKRSRRGLFGDDMQNDRNLALKLSLELNVPDDCPPVFLVNCKDDPIVNYHNSELLDEALTRKGISHRYIQYETGGHGFGASDTKGTDECRRWKNEFLMWLPTILDN